MIGVGKRLKLIPVRGQIDTRVVQFTTIGRAEVPAIRNARHGLAE